MLKLNPAPLLRVLVIGCLCATGISRAAQLPLASIKYFNPYQNPTNWGGWGSAVYSGGGATVRNVSGTLPVDVVDGGRSMVIDSVNPPGAYWNVLFKVSGNSLNFLRTGTNPAVHLRLRWSSLPTNSAWNLNIGVEGALRPLNAYVTASTSVWQDVFIPASDFIAAKPSVDLSHVWQIAVYAAGNYRDHCVLNISALDLVPGAGQLQYTDFVKVNQVGYSPLMGSKLGVVSWEPGTLASPPSSFQVVDVNSSQVVYAGALTPFQAPPIWQAGGWLLDGDLNYQADFGALTAPGTYRLEVPGIGAQSVPFVIATNVYQGLFRDALRFFYYSRSGVPIAQPYAEGFTRPALFAGNSNATYNYSSTKGHYHFGSITNRDAHGCWFDAGDTHVDVPNTAIACWFLLETYRDFGRWAPPGGLNLPDSSAQQSDLLPLITWGLDWLKRMQNADGSVHQYVVTGSSGTTQQVSDISSFAAACAAATFAKASVVLGGALSPAENNDLITRAQLSWSWLQANTGMVQPRLPLNNGVDPGADDTFWGDVYFDRRCRAFAAVELFEATGLAVYNTAFLNQFSANGGSPLNGSTFNSNQTGYGSDNVISYLNHPLNFAFIDYARSSRAADPTVRATLKNAFIHQADVLTNYTALSGYRIPMLYPGHLFWGASGGVLAPSAMTLVRAFEWTGNTNYFDTAMHAFHFICGRNPVNRIFVSGYGDSQHGSDFYSQFWTNLLHLPPGYLGGNINVTGSATPVVEFPWKRFINTQDADMTEPGVYWNSAFAWLAGCAVEDASLPDLAIAAPASGFSISWPLRSAPFTLRQTADPASPWNVVPNSPAISNRTCTVTLPADDAGAGYFRLQLP
ncbi:MAG: glycoside hydrolase family 9 protein [Verrucomicrobiota bacterium]